MTEAENRTIEANCPGCGERVAWDSGNRWRPFCSRRCKDADFIDWAEENRSIAGNASYDDLFSEGNREADQ